MSTERLLETDDAYVVAWLEKEALPGWFRSRRWYAGTSHGELPRLRFEELGQTAGGLILGLVAEKHTGHSAPPYLVALKAISMSERAVPDDAVIAVPPSGLAQVPCVLTDASLTDAGRAELLKLALGETTLPWSFGVVRGRVFERRNVDPQDRRWLRDTRPMGAEQSNTSIVYGDSAILKLLRRPGTPGQPNPDVEIPLALSVTTAEPLSPPVIGVIQAGDDDTGLIIGTLCRFLPNAALGWEMALEAARAAMIDPSAEPLQTEADARLGQYLAIRTAELHQALCRIPDNDAFAPVAVRAPDLRELGRQLEKWSIGVFDRLEAARSATADSRLASGIETLLTLKERIVSHFRKLATFDREDDEKTLLFAVRHHGDYHLGQVLWTDESGWQTIDFEGEPKRDIAERRRKAITLRDVAGMVRSFDYAQAVACRETGADETKRLRAAAWRDRIGFVYVNTYFAMAGEAENEIFPMIPDDRSLRTLLLEAFVIEKNLYELTYELDHRPDWFDVPLNGLLDYLASSD